MLLRYYVSYNISVSNLLHNSKPTGLGPHLEHVGQIENEFIAYAFSASYLSVFTGAGIREHILSSLQL